MTDGEFTRFLNGRRIKVFSHVNLFLMRFENSAVCYSCIFKANGWVYFDALGLETL